MSLRGTVHTQSDNVLDSCLGHKQPCRTGVSVEVQTSFWFENQQRFPKALYSTFLR